MLSHLFLNPTRTSYIKIPNTLLNNDCKIFSLILAKRLKTGLGNIIDEEQAGFTQGRNIHNNISLVVDMTDYNRCNSWHMETGIWNYTKVSASTGFETGVLHFYLYWSYMKVSMCNFLGISAMGREFKLCQLADDTLLFLRNKDEIPKAIQCIDQFSDVSGLKMNVKKSVCFPLKKCDLPYTHEVEVKDTVYLGITI